MQPKAAPELEAVQRQPEEQEESYQGKLIQLQAEDVEEELLQPKPDSGMAFHAAQLKPEITGARSTALSMDMVEKIRGLRGGGQPLPPGERLFFEPRFGCDLGGVRVHTDNRAAILARSIKARAFTFGNDMVFASGQFSPGSTHGRHLIAHELTHTLQQAGNGAVRRVVMRRWDPAGSNCSDVAANRWIKRVVVEQEQPQSVTLHWNDGSTEADITSTGKGQCCVDPATPEGVTCTQPRSCTRDSNCTPITERQGYRIRNRYLDYNGWEFWSDFVTSRGIGLHYHHTVDKTPLSHGCVRLNRNHARRIFCGARRHRTKVQVRGFARPRCDHGKLIDEWESDINYARTPTDGENVTPSLRRGIRATRRTLRSAFGQTRYQQYMSGVAPSRQQIAANIPRCSERTLLPTAEEARLIGPRTPQGTVPVQILAASGFDRFLVPFTQALCGVGTFGQARNVVLRYGIALWNAARSRAQRAQGGSTDDRPLYWARLEMSRALRQWHARFPLSAARRDALLSLLERSSRGITSVRFRGGAAIRRILISGFDPFGLGSAGDVRRGNPSGAAVLALDGRRITSGGITAHLEGVVFPVRFADFNAGLVEQVFGPRLGATTNLHMVMTISQGGSTAFEVERYAGRRRSSTATGNVGAVGGGTPSAPSVPPGLAPGPEFLSTTLPEAAIRSSLGRSAPLPGEIEVTEIPAVGQSTPSRRVSGPSSGATAVAGSGGGYLSNEIFYRTALLRMRNGAQIPVGHLHTPDMAPPGTSDASRALFEQTRNNIVQQVEAILRATLTHI